MNVIDSINEQLSFDDKMWLARKSGSYNLDHENLSLLDSLLAPDRLETAILSIDPQLGKNYYTSFSGLVSTNKSWKIIPSDSFCEFGNNVNQ